MTNPVASDISKILSSNFGGVIDLRPHVSDDDFFSSLTISILNEPNQGRGFVQTNFAVPVSFIVQTPMQEEQMFLLIR